MKKILLLLAMTMALPLSMLAQDDDLYFVPKKKSNVKHAKQTYYIGTDRDVDEYNRRGKFASTVTPLDCDESTDIIDFDGVAGVYPDSVAVDSVACLNAPVSLDSFDAQYYFDDDDDDYRFSRQLDRWYGIYDPWFYGPRYYGYHRYWHSPYYLYYGMYDPWYDPWYFGPCGWYDPWYSMNYWGWGGWYDPWYWGGFYPGFYPGFGHISGGIASRPSRGGAINKPNYATSSRGVGSRRSGWNEVAKLSEAKRGLQKQSAVTQGSQSRQGGRTIGRRDDNFNPSSSRVSSSFPAGGFSGGSGSSGGGFSGGGSRSGGGSGGSHGGRR